MTTVMVGVDFFLSIDRETFLVNKSKGEAKSGW